MPDNLIKYLSTFRYKRTLFDIYDRKFSFNFGDCSSEGDLVKYLVELYPDSSVEKINDYLDNGKSFYNEILKINDFKFPRSFDSGENLARLLFALIKLGNPNLVVETGVANGFSTKVILKALEGSRGVLHSFDVNPETEFVHQKSINWMWHKLDFRNPERDLKFQVSQLKESVDIWLHDSDHSKYWQTFEFRLASNHMSSKGILISDDIEDSSAWSILFNNHRKIQMADKHKVVGVVKPNRFSDQVLL